jgi:hypothetical protein
VFTGTGLPSAENMVGCSAHRRSLRQHPEDDRELSRVAGRASEGYGSRPSTAPATTGVMVARPGRERGGSPSPSVSALSAPEAPSTRSIWAAPDGARTSVSTEPKMRVSGSWPCSKTRGFARICNRRKADRAAGVATERAVALGPGQPLWRLSTRRDARSRRPHHAACGGCSRAVGRNRRPRRE